MNKKVSIVLLSLFGFAAINAGNPATAQVVAPAPASVESTTVASSSYKDRALDMCRTALSAVANHRKATAAVVGGAAVVGTTIWALRRFTPQTWIDYAKSHWRSISTAAVILAGAGYAAHCYSLPSKTWQSMTLENGKYAAVKTWASMLTIGAFLGLVHTTKEAVADVKEMAAAASVPGATAGTPGTAAPIPATTVHHDVAPEGRALTGTEKSQLKAWRRNAPSAATAKVEFAQLQVLEAAATVS